jgi:hypothetical protein
MRHASHPSHELHFPLNASHAITTAILSLAPSYRPPHTLINDFPNAITILSNLISSPHPVLQTHPSQAEAQVHQEAAARPDHQESQPPRLLREAEAGTGSSAAGRLEEGMGDRRAGEEGKGVRLGGGEGCLLRRWGRAGRVGRGDERLLRVL